MADKKKKEAEGEEEGGKKKGLPAVVLVAVGAALGGAGVVFAVPPKEVVKIVEPKPVEIIDVEHPDLLEFTFNPPSRSGRGTARIEFRFVYTVPEDRQEEAFEQIKERWSFVYSNLFMLLSHRSREELQSEAGKRMLEKDMMDELERTLFENHVVDGHPVEKVAKVTRILWKKMLFQ